MNQPVENRLTASSKCGHRDLASSRLVVAVVGPAAVVSSALGD